MFDWFRSGEAEAFGKELGAFMVAQLRGDLSALAPKNRKHADRTMAQAERKVQDFRAKHRLNVYKKSKCANAFLWSLKEAGWPEEYANQMVDWLTLRL